ncbi:MAG: MBL fold metallo-hydrolase, partial [Candidatus Aminicenantes bacterium]|nr:MBL fold metallo-hydrolase [Candidatus Aminicenantes bacterium]
MLHRSVVVTALLAALAGLACAGETVEGLPLHVKQLAPGVVRLWVGDHVSSTAVCAVATREGIVVIDTTDIPKLDQAFRKVIARELGRGDFKYLINTHGHADHTNGNGVYADCQIVAHERVAEMMRDDAGHRAQGITWRIEDIQRQKDQIASGTLDEGKKAAAEERIIINTLSVEFLKMNPAPTFPTKTFTDTMTLDCGDVAFELYQAGGTHTKSDILIFARQKGILFTGDMMCDKWLTDTPGCLATFAVHSGETADYPVLVRNWQALLDRGGEIKLYVPGHWNGELSAAGFRSRFDYLQALLADVPAMIRAGKTFDQIVAEYTLPAKFPQLAGSPGINPNGQRISIEHLYLIHTGKISVGQALWGMFQEETFAAEFPPLKADILENPDKYFFSEAQLNS